MMKQQPQNEKGHFTSPEKSTEKPMRLYLGTIADDKFICHNNDDGKLIHTNIENEL